MCAAYNKRVVDWLRYQETFELFETLSRRLGGESNVVLHHDSDISRLSASDYEKNPKSSFPPLATVGSDLNRQSQGCRKPLASSHGEVYQPAKEASRLSVVRIIHVSFIKLIMNKADLTETELRRLARRDVVLSSYLALYDAGKNPAYDLESLTFEQALIGMVLTLVDQKEKLSQLCIDMQNRSVPPIIQLPTSERSQPIIG